MILILAFVLWLYWLRRRRELPTPFGPVIVASERERERMRRHPDFRPPWEAS